MIKKWKKYENKNIKNYIYNIMSSGKKIKMLLMKKMKIKKLKNKVKKEEL